MYKVLLLMIGGQNERLMGTAGTITALFTWFTTDLIMSLSIRQTIGISILVLIVTCPIWVILAEVLELTSGGRVMKR